MEEFAERGFKNAGMSRVLLDLGMSKSSFYHYFEDKADLYRQTIDYYLLPYFSDVVEFDFSSLTAEDFWSTLHAFFEMKSRMSVASVEMRMILMIITSLSQDPVEKEMSQKYLILCTQWIRDMIRQGQILGMVRTDLGDELLFAMVMGLSTSMDQWVVENTQNLSKAELVAVGEAAVDGYKRLLQPAT